MRVKKTAVFTDSPVFQNRGNVWVMYRMEPKWVQGVWVCACLGMCICYFQWVQGVWALLCRPVITGFSRCASAPILRFSGRWSWDLERGEPQEILGKEGLPGALLYFVTNDALALLFFFLVFGPATMPEIQVNSAPALELTLTKHVFLRLHTQKNSMLYNGFHCFQPWADLKALPAQKKSTKPLTFCDLSKKWI